MNEESTPPVEATEPTHPTTSAPTTGDRVFRLRSVVAVGAAALVLGGLGGTAIGFAADDGSGHPEHPARMGGDFPDRHGGGGPGFAPPGQMPPGPPPGTGGSNG